MKLQKPLILIILIGLLLAACAPVSAPVTGGNQTPLPPTPFDGGVPQPQAADAAQQLLAEQFGIDPGQFVLREIEEVEWPNACLGLAQVDEMCAEVITPGFRLVFEAQGQRYEVHTNQDGSQLRVADDIPAVAAAIAALAEQIGTALDRIRLIEAEQVTWSDSCLGAGGPAESCLQVITPGYRVVLEVDGKRYQVHTNMDGSAVRIVDPANLGQQPGPGADPNEIVARAQNQLAQQLGIPASEINLASLEAVDWPDACLGAQLPGQMCAQVITLGYRIVFDALGANYAFHTDDAGGVILPAIPPLPETAGTVITWEQDAGSDCSQVEVGVQGAAAGACGAEQQAADLSPQRVLELAYLYAVYASFEGKTPSGTIQFTGQGAQQPSEVEMRSAAEWARLVAQETAGDQDDAAGLALEWSRTGGFAGFCDGLAISLTGWVQPSSCRGDSPVNFLPYRMSADELEQLYAWIDELQRFEYDHTDAAAADAMTIRAVFNGSGTKAPSDADQEEIARFAEQLYSQSMH